MQDTTWKQAVAEIGTSLVDAVVRFFKQDLVQVGLTGLMFLALALPMLLVMLILWYIDSTGWRPAGGFYKIGAAGPEAVQACAAQLGLLALVRRAPPAPWASHPLKGDPAP